jgi:hypothetical protein
MIVIQDQDKSLRSKECSPYLESEGSNTNAVQRFAADLDAYSIRPLETDKSLFPFSSKIPKTASKLDLLKDVHAQIKPAFLDNRFWWQFW